MLHIYLPADGSKTVRNARGANVPVVMLVGRIMEKTPEGLIVNCTRDAGADYVGGGAVNAYGRFLIKGYPAGPSMTGGEVITVQGVDEGNCYSSGEYLQTYRYAGAGAGASQGTGNRPFDSLNAPTRQVGGWTKARK